MKHSIPISLFSFQDIITSLTGVLIVIVLIIALEMVEAMSSAAARSELLPDYLHLSQKAAELNASKEQLQQALANGENGEQNPYAKLSLSELRDLIKRENRYLSMLNDKSAADELRCEELRRVNEALSQQLKDALDELAALTKDEKQLKELQSTLLELQQRQKHIDQLIERKRKQLRISFQGTSTHKPILIECHGWGFRAQCYPDGEIVTFGEQTSRQPQHKAALISWLKKNAGKGFYIALLFKEEAIVHSNDLLIDLAASGLNLNIGKEPIGGQESGFHE